MFTRLTHTFVAYVVFFLFFADKSYPSNLATMDEAKWMDWLQTEISVCQLNVVKSFSEDILFDKLYEREKIFENRFGVSSKKFLMENRSISNQQDWNALELKKYRTAVFDLESKSFIEQRTHCSGVGRNVGVDFFNSGYFNLSNDEQATLVTLAYKWWKMDAVSLACKRLDAFSKDAEETYLDKKYQMEIFFFTKSGFRVLDFLFKNDKDAPKNLSIYFSRVYDDSFTKIATLQSNVDRHSWCDGEFKEQ